MPHLQRDAFCRIYLEEHAPLVLKHCPRLRRYVINLVERTPDESDFDAVAEFWLDDVQDFFDRRRFYASEQARTAVSEHAFGIVRAAIGYHVRETIQRGYERSWPDGERSPGVKMIAPLRRLDGVTREDFKQRWVQTHAPLALEHVPGIWRYVTNVVVSPLASAAPDFDGIVEVHRRRIEDLKMRPTPAGQAIVDEDTDSLIVRPKRNQLAEYILKS
jgi:hypothetical protein